MSEIISVRLNDANSIYGDQYLTLNNKLTDKRIASKMYSIDMEANNNKNVKKLVKTDDNGNPLTSTNIRKLSSPKN